MSVVASKNSFLKIDGLAKVLNINWFQKQPHGNDEEKCRLLWFGIQIVSTQLFGKVQVTLVWNSNSEHSTSAEKLNALSNLLWRHGGPRNNNHLIHSIWANFQTSSTNIIFGNRWRHLLGEKDFWDHVGGVDISLASSSFGQANTQVSYFVKEKDEKRPWILHARTAPVHIESKTNWDDEIQSWPQTLIYISCGG